jgi:hypothetical protein
MTTVSLVLRHPSIKSYVGMGVRLRQFQHRRYACAGVSAQLGAPTAPDARWLEG